MEEPKRNQSSGQNQSDINQDDSGEVDQGIAGGIASTDDTAQEDAQTGTDMNQSNDDMSTEE